MLPGALFIKELHTDASVPSTWEIKEDKSSPNLERIHGMSRLIPESDSNRCTLYWKTGCPWSGRRWWNNWVESIRLWQWHKPIAHMALRVAARILKLQMVQGLLQRAVRALVCLKFSPRDCFSKLQRERRQSWVWVLKGENKKTVERNMGSFVFSSKP